MSTIDDKLTELFDLFTKYGSNDYIGEPVSLQIHSIQCAMLAESDYPDNQDIILGALFHDIGHMIGEQNGSKQMITNGINLGINNHAMVGAEYLKSLGFSDTVCKMVGSHVQAKKYLCYANPEYYESLTLASKQTLIHQGGIMNHKQAKEFENDDAFMKILKLRHWDEMAKDDKKTDHESIDYYKIMCRNHLKAQENAIYSK